MELDSNNIEEALNKLEAELAEQYKKAFPGKRRKISIMREGITEARKKIRELVSEPNPESQVVLPETIELLAKKIHDEYCNHPMVNHTGHVESLSRDIKEHIMLIQLASKPDSEIDTSDIPEIKDFSGAVRGKFRRPNLAEMAMAKSEAEGHLAQAIGNMICEAIREMLESVFRNGDTIQLRSLKNWEEVVSDFYRIAHNEERLAAQVQLLNDFDWTREKVALQHAIK